MVKVTFSFDDEKMAKLMRFTGAKTKTEAVNIAMREYVESFSPEPKGAGHD